jgi:hypothetical protein
MKKAVLSKPETKSRPASKTVKTSRQDPILAELWVVKARLNREARYDPAILMRNIKRMANAFRAASD